ncbi:hypothetical protein ACIXOK_03020 [Bacteroides fragilis]
MKDDRVVLNLPSDKYFPYPQLLAEQYLDIRYFSPWMTQKLTLTWDDELKEGKVLEQIVTL